MANDDLTVPDSDLPPQVRELLDFPLNDAKKYIARGMVRYAELLNCSARVSAVVWGASVQDELKLAIEARLLRGEHAVWLLKPDGPLGSFRAMHEVAHAAGMISDNVRNDLCHIRKIRNEFAHKVTIKGAQREPRTVTFETDKVSYHAGELVCPDIMKFPDMRPEIVERLREERRARRNEVPRPAIDFPRIHPMPEPRKRFEWTCQCLCAMLEILSQIGPIIHTGGSVETNLVTSRIRCDWKTTGEPMDYQPSG